MTRRTGRAAAAKPAAKKPAARGKRAAAKKPPARRRVAGAYPRSQRAAVASFLDMRMDDPALPAVLAVQEATGLSVFNGELFAIEEKVPSRDAQGVVGEKWVRRPAAGRDGFLAVAERSGVFGGIVGDVVCANDLFDVDWSADSLKGGPPWVKHRHAPVQGGLASAEQSRAYRGPIIGAWAKGWRSDRAQPFFYFAPLNQHGRVFGTAEQGELSWLGAWEYTNAMILKCAMSYVLRILFVITGVLPADELKNDPTIARETLTVSEAAERVRQTVNVAQVLAIPDAIPAGPLHGRLLAAVEAANRLHPNAWTAAKVDMTMRGRPEEELATLAAEIEAGNERRVSAATSRAVMPDAGRALPVDAPPVQ